MAQSSDTQELRWLYRQAKPYRSLYLLRICTVLVTSLLGLLDPLILKWLIDDILPWRRGDMLLVAALTFFFIFVFRFSLSALSLLTDTYTSQRLAFDIRNKLLRHLQTLSPEYHLQNPRGQLLHRLEQDVDQVCEVGGHTIASVFRIATMTVLSVAIMALLNWKLTLVLLPLVPFMIYLRRRSQKRLREASDRVQAASSARVGFLQDHLGSIVQVQLLDRCTGERRRLARLGRAALEAHVHRQGKELKLSFSSQVALVIATAVVLGFGGAQVLSGALTVGGLVAFYSYLHRIFSPVETLVHLYSEIQRAGASIRRIRQVLRQQPGIVDPPKPRHLAPAGPMAAELSQVRFQYPTSKPVLEDLDLVLRPGEKVALVGGSGSGKSTVARLLTRQYDPDRGRVLLDGIPIQDLRLRALRARVALVPQEPLLFDATLEDNLRFANPHVSDRELRRVLATAQLTTTVDELPDGLQERVGARGDRLSGGQRQRVAVARAILQDPRLVILDEATSALDGFTEHRLFTALNEFVETRTVLLIAHRLSAIRWADRIVVLDRGHAVAEGPHDRLFRDNELYRRLCEEQLQEGGGGLESEPAQAAETPPSPPREAALARQAR